MRSKLLIYMLLMLSLTSCYRERTAARLHDVADVDTQFVVDDTLAIALTRQQQDSLTFARTHHYSENFNFVVRADSMSLIRQEPEEWINGMIIDSFVVK